MLENLIGKGAPPLVAILRGITPDMVIEVADALVEEGVKIIEVPLNSPNPLASIEKLALKYGDKCLVGAGTVLDIKAVQDVKSVGGKLIVTPNFDKEVVLKSLEEDLEIIPGILTPSEAFGAIKAGVKSLKIFPSSVLGPDYFKALKEVLPKEATLYAVGGTNADNLAIWMGAGAGGLGIGSWLYKANDKADGVRIKARKLVAAWEKYKKERV